MEQNKTALIAMSGGVDSSVTAYLLNRDGYQCKGATMLLYDKPGSDTEEGACGSTKDADDAAAIAARLDMPFFAADFREDFKEKVIEKFIRTYEEGGTPNPCVDCNRNMKFSRLLDFADANDCYYVATGHYVRVEQDEKTGRFLLKKAADPKKDQTYVLYMLTQKELSRVKFPLGELTKPEVRRIAEENGFVTAHKHDSQDICFVPDGDYAAFMERYTGKTYPEGNYLDLDGKVIGRHKGAVHYTLGQRKGLGIALGAPAYVCAKCMKDNTVTLGPEENIFTKTLIADEVNWIPFDQPDGPLQVTACTRYHQKEQKAVASMTEDGRLRLDFEVPQRAVTAGQAVVMYDGDIVLGGGTIRESY